jgi:MATE family multidrug resistance protein
VLGYGGAGIWLGMAVGLALAGVFMLVRFWGWSVRGVQAPATPRAG